MNVDPRVSGSEGISQPASSTPAKKEEPGHLHGRIVKSGSESLASEKVEHAVHISPPPSSTRTAVAPSRQPSAENLQAREKIKQMGRELSQHLVTHPMPSSPSGRTEKVKKPVAGTKEEPPVGPSRTARSPVPPSSAEAPRGPVRGAKLSSQADLKTKQGPGADRVALRTQAYLMGAMAHADGSNMTRILSAKSPQEQLRQMVGAFRYVSSAARMDNPNDCKLLNELAALMSKGFGVGVGRFPSGWKSEWNDLGKKDQLRFREATDLSWKDAGLSLEDMKLILGRTDLTSRAWENQKLDARDLAKMRERFPEQLAKVNKKVYELQGEDFRNNDKLRRAFGDMLNFVSDRGASLLDRHPAGADLTIVQLQAIFGQLVHDFILETKKMPSGAILRNYMETHGLIANREVFMEIARLENNMRNNPLLAEIPSHQIVQDIALALQETPSSRTRDDMLDFFKDRLEECARQQGRVLSDVQLNELAGKVLNEYVSEIRRMRPRAFKTGERGRVDLGPSFGSKAGQALAGAPGEALSFSVMPNRSDDRLAREWAQRALDDAGTRAFTAETAKGQEGILSHIGSPTNVLRLGKGLDSALVDFAEHPEKLLQKAIGQIIPSSTAEAGILAAFSEDFNTPEPLEQLKGMIGGIDVTFNDATRQRMALGKFASHSSVASIMHAADLRTICSISGTTVDACVGMMLSMGREGMQTVLQPLLNYAENFATPPRTPPYSLDTPEAQPFKELLTTVSFFMQTGQYHTAGEVLGGLFIVARGLFTSPRENTDIDKTFQMFEGLMRDFASNPAKFLAVKAADVARIDTALPEAETALQAAQQERAQEHRRETIRL